MVIKMMVMIVMMMLSGHSEADVSRGGCAQTQDCVEERGRGQDQGEEQPPSAQVTSYILPQGILTSDDDDDYDI